MAPNHSTTRKTLRMERIHRVHSTTVRYHGIGGAGNRVYGSASSSASISSFSTIYASPPPAYAARDPLGRIERIKAHIQAHIDAWNARTRLFDAWQRNFPTYSASTYAIEKAYPREKTTKPSSQHFEVKVLVAKLKAHIQAQIDARNARSDLYAAWQRKPPTYPTQTYPTENAYPCQDKEPSRKMLSFRVKNLPLYQ